MKDIDPRNLTADEWDELNFPRPDVNDFDQVVERAISRRGFLGGALAFGSGAAVMGTGMLSSTSAQAQAASRFPFTPIGIQTDFEVHVPQGYSTQVLARWGDPLMSAADGYDLTDGGPVDGSDMVFGENTDGMETFSFRGHELIAINHEYTNRGTNLPAGQEGTPADAGDVLKLQNLQGVTVMEVRETDAGWEVVKDSPFNRRITHNTPMTLVGPAAGHELLQTEADPTGTAALGTLNNCGSGKTPWGTYLTCEDNVQRLIGGVHRMSAMRLKAGWRGKYGGCPLTAFGGRWLGRRTTLTSGNRARCRDCFGQVPTNRNRHAAWVGREFDPDPTRPAPRSRHSGLGRFTKHETRECGIWRANGRVVGLHGR